MYFFICAFLILNFSLTACTIDAEIWSGDFTSSHETYVFDVSHLDFAGLHKQVYSTSTASNGELQVQLNMEEYIYMNKVKFVNLPIGAELLCDGADPNVALQALDLATEMSFSLKINYWVATDPEWADLQALNFNCWYEVSGQRSSTIHFSVHLQEAPVARVSVPTYTGAETHGHAEYGVLSGNGLYLAFVTSAAKDEADLNGIKDIYVLNRETQEVRRVSVSSSGGESNGASTKPKISADGRFIVFESAATNLVVGDTNGQTDIFVHDMETSTTSRVSVDSSGVQGNNLSFDAAISADGHYVAFASSSSNLVAGDTNGIDDIFVHDLATAVTSRVSVATDGTQGNSNVAEPALSSDGRYVVFKSLSSNLVAGDTNFTTDIFIRDRQSSTTTRISVDSLGTQANGQSLNPSISGDGRYVVYRSFASNLVSADTNGVGDIFLLDRQTGAVTRVSVDGGGTQANGHSYLPVISTDGTAIAFGSQASNLVIGDTNGDMDIFVYKIQSAEIQRVSLNNTDDQANGYSGVPSLSADGRYVSMESDASNLVSGTIGDFSRVFVRDIQTGTMFLSSFESLGGEGDDYSLDPSLSADGRYVCFESYASNLVPGDSNGAEDVFVHDRKTGVTTRVSVDSTGAEADSDSYVCSISGDGRYVAYASSASNLVAGDTNWREDIFVHDRQSGVTTRVSVDSGGIEADDYSYNPSISFDGRYVAFDSQATNLVPGDTNGQLDVFVHDRQTGITKRISVTSLGAQANSGSQRPAINSDGRYISFSSSASNLVAGDTNARTDIFVHDQQTAATTRVSMGSGGIEGNNNSDYSAVSGDGRYVAFESSATNFVAGDTNGMTDIFIHDQLTGLTSLVSAINGGGWGNGNSHKPSLDQSGRFIAYQSYASNVVSADTNAQPDLFVFDQTSGEAVRVSSNSLGQEGNNGSYSPVISADGRYVAGSCYATNLIWGDANLLDDIFLFNWQ